MCSEKTVQFLVPVANKNQFQDTYDTVDIGEIRLQISKLNKATMISRSSHWNVWGGGIMLVAELYISNNNE